ncbi:MAG TPA: hypothetical protein PLL92_02510 [Alicycliphilus sp.]|nr:hypothetical protein [Alicycliphilus sp.]
MAFNRFTRRTSAALPVRRATISAPALPVPAYIEHTARQLGARFERIPVLVTRNVDADVAQVHTYLGTYMPRTVLEFQTIGSELLSIPAVREGLPRGRTLRVLDIGSGTGGAWMGLAGALRQALDVRQLDVVATDGNAYALGLQPAFLRPLSQELGLGICLNREHFRLGLSYAAFMNDLSALLGRLQGQFDFILVSKHLSEFYQAGGQQAQPIVGAALHLLSQRLHATGSLVLLDVTQRTGAGTDFFPVRLARELSQYLAQEPEGLRPVLPVPCALHALTGCAAQSSCFTQREFALRLCNPQTGEMERVSSKVTYRVFAHAQHARRISSAFAKGDADFVTDQDRQSACVDGAIVSTTRSRNGFSPD